jgi:hypothetical protein
MLSCSGEKEVSRMAALIYTLHRRHYNEGMWAKVLPPGLEID